MKTASEVTGLLEASLFVSLRQSLYEDNKARRMASWTQQVWIFGSRMLASTCHHYNDVVQEI